MSEYPPASLMNHFFSRGSIVALCPNATALGVLNRPALASEPGSFRRPRPHGARCRASPPGISPWTKPGTGWVRHARMAAEHVNDTAVFWFQIDAYRAGARQRPHTHDDLHFSMLLRGRVSETVGRRTERATPLSIVAKDAGVRHSNQFDPSGVRIARLSMANGTLEQLLDDPRRAHGWRWSHDPRVARPFLRLVRRANGASTCLAVNDPDVIDLLAMFTAGRVNDTGSPPAWLEQVIRELREGWSPTVNVTTLARRAGVHPVYLARCVRRWYGTGLAEELRRQRLRAVVERITSTTATISDVAHSAGYADEPHLNREFRQAIGLPPGHFRTMIHSTFARRC